jgi:hypothetical protein
MQRTFFIALAALLLLAPGRALAQVYFGVPAPPLLVEYTQPLLTQPNEIWQPGYWAWGPAGYYWVPGTWVEAPGPNMWWTPGYWSWLSNGYQWNPGYWGNNVGYYGGVNYGAGYYGNGYVGGNWAGPVFRYNTAVTHVNTTIIHNTYIDRTVVVNHIVRVAYNGGPHGIKVHPTPAQVSQAKAHRVTMTPQQREHESEAQMNRNNLTTVNHGAPAHVTVTKPLQTAHRPPDFAPVTAADRAAAPHPKPPPPPHQAPPAHQAPPPHTNDNPPPK